MRILMLEDNSALAENFVEILSREGHVVTAVESSTAARELVFGEPAASYDVLVTDLRLPGGSGLAFVRELRSRGSRIPVLVVTAFPEAELSVENERLELTAILAKPVKVPHLLERLRACAEGRRGLA